MDSDNAAIVTLTDDWMESNASTTVQISETGFFADQLGCGCRGWCSCHTIYVQPYGFPWLTTTSTSDIYLTMAEVDVLRKLARKDKKLRRILEKFTPHIRVQVSFA